MRTTKTSPLRLWLSSQNQDPIGLLESINEDELVTYGAESFLDETGGDDSNERPILNPPGIDLSDICQHELQLSIPDVHTLPNHGIDLYLRAVTIIQQYTFDNI